MSRSETPESTKLKEMQAIPKWTRRYAQNRTVPVLLFMIVFLAMSAAIGGTSYLAGFAYRAKNTPLLAVALIGVIASVLFCFWFSNPWWGGKWLERASLRLYENEGAVSLPSGFTDKDKAIGVFAGMLFAACILASVALGNAGMIPTRLMQPVSAIYCVPFLLFLTFRQKHIAGWIPFLWPFLYALHAILVLMGAPIQFEGPWQGLNMLIPTAGYGLLTGLIGHFYSRYALAQLRKVAGEGK